MEKQRAYVYDNLKFFLILCVVVGHIIEPYVGETALFRGMNYFVYAFHVPAFIFISGLFAKRTLSDKTRTKENVAYFFVLAILAEIGTFLVYLCWGKRTSYSFFGNTSISWYIFCLAAWYGITYLLKRFDIRALLVFSILLGCFVGYDSRFGDFLHLSRLIVYYPVFLTGYLLDPEKLMKFTGRIPSRIIGGCGLLTLIYFCFFQTDLLAPFRSLFSGRNPFSAAQLPFGGFYRLIYYFAVVFVILCLIAVAPRHKLITATWGSRSLQPYLLHMLPFVYSMRFIDLGGIFHAWIGDGWLWQILLMCVGVLLSILLSFKIFEFPFKWIRNFCKLKPPAKPEA